MTGGGSSLYRQDLRCRCFFPRGCHPVGETLRPGNVRRAQEQARQHIDIKQPGMGGGGMSKTELERFHGDRGGKDFGSVAMRVVL